MISQGDDARRGALRSAFAQAIAATNEQTLPDPETIAPEHGLLAGDDLIAIRAQALRDVVAPCAARLLDFHG